MAGDTVYSQEHLTALWNRLCEGGVDGCILLKELPFQRLGGSSVVVLKQDGTLDAMISKPSTVELRRLKSSLADASLHIYSRDLMDYLRRAELSRTNELEVTTALRDWIDDGARIAGIAGDTPPHITDLEDFVVHNVPYARRFVTVSEIERAVNTADDTDISSLIQALEPPDVPFVYKRLTQLSAQPMGPTKQARVLALISEILRYQAQACGFDLAPELEEKLVELDVEQFIEEVGPQLHEANVSPAVYHYLAVAYARQANTFVADSVFAEALSRMPDAERPVHFESRVHVQTPARLAFSSSQGSDISYIIEEKGAAILNCAIKVNGEYPGTITVERTLAQHIELVAEDLNTTGVLWHYDDIFGHIPQNDPLVLLKAGLRFSGIINPGHAETLQDWLKQYDSGIKVTLHCSISRGSGLGCSAILAAGLVRGLREFVGLGTTDAELLLRSYCCERYYGRSGYQDIIGGSAGGVKLIQADGLTALFAPRIEELDLGQDQIDGISRNLIVFYTGEPHIDSPYLLTIPAKYFTRSSDYMYAYENGKQLTHAMAEALRNDDWEKMGHLITDYWDDREFFEHDVTPDFARKLRVDLAAWSHGTALCGSGHGGYMMVVPRPGEREVILEYLAQNGIDGEQILEFTVTQNGLAVEAD